MLRIVTHPHPALRFKSVPVTKIDATLRSVVQSMFELMYEAQGIGLAANQVGLPFRFFIINVAGNPEDKENERVFINPEIYERHDEIVAEEGCLSLPGLNGDVRRSRVIRVRALDLTGKLIDTEARALFSRAIQHENDHLDGVLITDRFESETLEGARDQLAEIEATYRNEQQAGTYLNDERLQQQVEELAKGGLPNDLLHSSSDEL